MSSKITRFTISGITAVGGGLTAYSNSVARGNIKAVYVDYDSTAPSGTTLVLSDNEGQTILTLSSVNTDGWYYPRANAQTSAGVDRVFIASGQLIPVEFTVFSQLKAVITSGGDAKTFKAVILVEEY
jgi:hypothetical protein